MYGLSSSTRLKTINLSNVQTHEHDPYSTFNLTWFLEPVQKCSIKRLHLASNAFKAIYPGIIRYAPHLEYIDVSHNLLVQLLASAFFMETLLHKGLQQADFSYQGFYNDKTYTDEINGKENTHRLPSSEPEEFSDERRATGNIQRNLDTGTFQQRISAIIIPDAISSQPWLQCINATNNDPCEAFSPNCSKILDYLRQNHGLFCELLYTVFDDPLFENFYRGIMCSALPRVDDIFQKSCGGCIVIPTMGSTTRLHLNNLNIYDQPPDPFFTFKSVCFHPSNQLEYVNFSENFEHGYQHITFYLSLDLIGLTHINVLNVSNDGIFVVSPNILLNFPNLQVLDMSRNEISFYSDRSMRLKSNSTHIQNLSFASNDITMIPQNVFSDLVSLHEIDLSNNRIQNFDFNISGLYSLEKLNLEHNTLFEIPEAACQQLRKLAERVAPRVITVDLSNNKLLCTCSNILFLTFMKQTKPANLVFNNYDKYLCNDQANNPILLHKINLLSLWFSCLGSGVYVGIGFGCAFVVLTISLLLAVTIYRKRWWFRYQYFVAHRVWKNYNKAETCDTPFEYDLFVSYNQHDYQWADEVMQPKLEDELDLRLCLHHRDFRLGEVITEQIVESVQSSKKTLFILSKSFLASTWCHFEIRMAQSRLFTTGKDVILLALLEPLPDRMVSKTLKGLLETRTYVEWTENDTYGQKLFWEKLYESVKAPIAQPFDLEERAPPPGIQTEDMRDSSINEAASREREPLLA